MSKKTNVVTFRCRFHGDLQCENCGTYIKVGKLLYRRLVPIGSLPDMCEECWNAYGDGQKS